MKWEEGVNYWKDTRAFFENGCPFCKTNYFLEGPHGGCSVNFMCQKCKAKYNDMGYMGVELLSKPETDVAVDDAS